MLEAALAMGFWIWALIIIEVILLFIFVEHEQGIWATVSFVTFLGLMQWFGVDVFGYAYNNPLNVGIFALSFIAIGAGWACAEWRWYCKDARAEYDNRKIEFLEDQGLKNVTKTTEVPVHLRTKWKGIVEGTQNYKTRRTIADAPRIRDNKARWMRWATLWPIGMVWSSIDNFVVRTWNNIYEALGGMLQNMSDSFFSSTSNDLEIPDVERESDETPE